MLKTKFAPFIILFSPISLLTIFLVQAQAVSDVCYQCQDIQHASTLASIEKYMLQVQDSSLQELDEEAKEWYAKFQKGGLFFDGWQEISEDVVAIVPEKKKLETKVTMEALGVKIGCEWSKENDTRKISTDNLKKWGKELRKTVKKSPDALSLVINSIESEVDELLL